jgi:prolipoprotein diacylglyceryltransferase
MYPTFYDLVLDLFGVSIPAFKFMQSYGMMVGIGFIVGSVLLAKELKRKEALGQLKPVKKKQTEQSIRMTTWETLPLLPESVLL